MGADLRDCVRELRIATTFRPLRVTQSVNQLMQYSQKEWKKHQEVFLQNLRGILFKLPRLQELSISKVFLGPTLDVLPSHFILDRLHLQSVYMRKRHFLSMISLFSEIHELSYFSSSTFCDIESPEDEVPPVVCDWPPVPTHIRHLSLQPPHYRFTASLLDALQCVSKIDKLSASLCSLHDPSTTLRCIIGAFARVLHQPGPEVFHLHISVPRMLTDRRLDISQVKNAPWDLLQLPSCTHLQSVQFDVHMGYNFFNAAWRV